MKTLLIPTDFNVTMLGCVPGIVQHFAPQEVNVVLVHMMKITDNVQELLMLSRRSAEHQYISQEFYNACTALKQTQPGLNKIAIEFFYGSTLAVFRNFLEAQRIDNIVLLHDYEYAMLNKNSVEPTFMANRSGVNIMYTNCAGTMVNGCIINNENLVAEAV